MQQPALVLPWLESLQQSLEPYPTAWPATVLAALVAVAWLAISVTRRRLLRGLLTVMQRVSGHGEEGRRPLRVISRLANGVPSVVIAAGLILVPDLPPDLVR